MTDENLVKEITGIVLQKLFRHRKKMLVVLCGTERVSDYVLSALKDIRSAGYEYDLLVSRTAYELYSLDELRDDWQPSHLWVDHGKQSEDRFAMRYDCIAAVDLTVPAAGRIAGCMPAGYAETVILNSLLFGKKVLVLKEACCPDCLKERPEINMTEALSETLRHHLRTIAGYGARVIRSSQFPEELQTMLLPISETKGRSSAENKRKEQTETAVSGQGFPGKILSVRDIKRYPAGSTVTIKARSMVTQMAEDYARRNRITIRREK